MSFSSYTKRLLGAALALTLGAAVTGCSDDETEDKIIPEIEVTQSLDFDCSKTETKELEIKLNGKVDWTIEADDWIALDRRDGAGPGTVKVTVEANATARTGKIKVTARGYMGVTDEGVCTVKQTPGGVPVEVETNVAEIRAKVLATEPAAEADLPDDIRALTLTGIVVSDKGGGNQQPFLVSVADKTAEAGAGLTLSIDKDANKFQRGDVIRVSLSDAKAEVYNGLLQVSTYNTPEIAERIDPLEPITITADKIAAYESQYVLIEHTQPEASETGTWNNTQNKGNVSMETLDGKSYKIRTLAAASFASDDIPSKSGSVAGIAGIYNTTLQLSPCNADDIRLTEERFTVIGGSATLAEALAAVEGSAFVVEGAQVVGANVQGVMLEQEGARMYAFRGEAHGLTVGDVVRVSGKTESRNGLMQFGKGCTLEKTGHAEASLPAPKTYAAPQIEAYMTAPAIEYVTLTGTILVAGNFVNVELDGTSVQGSLDYVSDEFQAAYDNHNLTITGWLFGAYKSFMYLLPVDVKDNGPVVEVVPEGALFFSSFDKKLSSQTFGDGGQWPFLDEFDGWQNHKGSGVAQVTYDYEHMSVRTNQSSKGSLSLYDGSGRNNIFFSTAPNHFTVQQIAVPSRNLRLTFGAQRYAQGGSNDFIKSDFEVRLSADGAVWSLPLDYDFGEVADEPGEWRRATADFTLPEGTSTLYIKFEAKLGSVNRIDDVLLTEGAGGQEIVFGAEEVIPLSTVAEVIAGEVDKKYKIEGQVIGTHSKGILTKDATGTILTFKKNLEFEVGDLVTITGATSEYGGMKQFGETAEIVKTGHEAFTQPAPAAFAAAEFDAYIAAPTIRYVEYTGKLTSYRDNYYQWHYNVAVEGTSVVGTVAYPMSTLNIDNLVDRNVKVTGYTIGVTGTDTKYLNTLTVQIEATEKEEMPDESTALTVKELNERLKTLTSGDALESLVAVKGYIAANNQGGNFYQMLSLTDNTGQAGTGIIIKGDDFTEKELPVGTKVIVSLKYATYDLYNGLPQLKKVTIFKTAEKATMIVPEITVAEAADYLGQYVTVKNLTPASTATTWVVNKKTTNTTFTDDAGNKILARVTNHAVFANEAIARKTANLSGILEIFKNDYQLFPNSMEDVAGFRE